MKRTKGRSHRSEVEIRKLVSGYEKGNQSRAAYCAAHGLPLTTLDYYRRRLRSAQSALVEIDFREAGVTRDDPGVFAVVLRNGRRLEIGWADLARVPHHGQPLRTLLGWLEEA